jgi:hypothetical protein
MNDPRLSLYDVINSSVDQVLRNLHTGLPGKVVSYSNTSKLAVVQPSIKYRGNDGSLLPMPKIYDVPVKQLCTQTAGIFLPIKKDDFIWIAFSEKALDTFISSLGQESDPGDDRKFDLTDAVAFIGLFGLAQDNNTDVIIINGSTTIKIKPSGNVVLNDVITVTPTGSTTIGSGTTQFLVTADAFTDMGIALTAIAAYINGIAPGTVVWPGSHVMTSLTTKTKAE